MHFLYKAAKQNQTLNSASFLFVFFFYIYIF